MKKKKARKFQSNAFAGFAAYRYGDEGKRPVYVPGRAPESLLKGQQREQVVAKVQEVMSGWTFSRFQFEGPMRAGLRSDLCMKGNGWDRSDLEAASLVEECLRNMRAERPSWEQGQPEFTEPRENCAHCGGTVPDDGHIGAKAYRYCGPECAKAAMEQRAFAERSEKDRAYAAAARILKRSRTQPRRCKECNEPFYPVREGSAQAFCTQECGSRHSGRKRIGAKMPKRCEFCGELFLAGAATGKHCTKACGEAARKLRDGKVPRQLTRPLFDHFFTVPNNASRPVWLTPERFDQMMVG